MEFDWDAANVEHVARHGVTTQECEEAYRNGLMVIEHQRRKHEERPGKIRFVTALPMHPSHREIYREEE